MSHPDDDLLERLLAQQLAEDAIRDLNARLAVDADLRRRLIHLADEHASLRQALVLNPVRLGRRPLAARRPLLVRRSLLVRVSAAALLVLGIAAGSWWWALPSSLLVADGVRQERDRPIPPGTRRLELGGFVTIDLSHDATVLVTGRPGAEQVRLAGGSAHCHIIPHRGRFTLSTAVGDIAVVGTEFTAQLQGDAMSIRSALITVTAGVVLVSGPWGETRLTAGEAATIPPAPHAVNERDALVNEVMIATKWSEALAFQLAMQLFVLNPKHSPDGAGWKNAMLAAQSVVSHSAALQELLRSPFASVTLTELKDYRDFLLTPAGSGLALAVYEHGVDRGKMAGTFSGLQRMAFAALGSLHPRPDQAVPISNPSEPLRAAAQRVTRAYGYDASIANVLAPQLISQAPRDTTVETLRSAMLAAMEADPTWKDGLTDLVQKRLSESDMGVAEVWLATPSGRSVAAKMATATPEFIRQFASVLTADNAGQAQAKGQQPTLLAEVEDEFKRLQAAVPKEGKKSEF